MHARWRVGAVLLAAGEGRRMGGVSKPLICVDGVPLIRRQLIALRGAGVDEVVVVTGHARAAIEAQMQDFSVKLAHKGPHAAGQHFSVRLAHNAAHAAGQQSSVRVGLAALTGALDAVLIVLADQPLIGASDLLELIAAFKQRPRGHVLVPVVGAARGNPVVIDETALTRVLESEANLGCRHLIDRHPEIVHVHETTNKSFLTDIDTVADMRELAKRTGWTFELPPAAPAG